MLLTRVDTSSLLLLPLTKAVNFNFLLPVCLYDVLANVSGLSKNGDGHWDFVLKCHVIRD